MAPAAWEPADSGGDDASNPVAVRGLDPATGEATWRATLALEETPALSALPGEHRYLANHHKTGIPPRLFRVGTDGGVEWTHRVDDPSVQVVQGPGGVYVAGHQSDPSAPTLTAIGHDGTVRWDRTYPSEQGGGVVPVGDGLLRGLSTRSGLVGIDPASGAVRWSSDDRLPTSQTALVGLHDRTAPLVCVRDATTLALVDPLEGPTGTLSLDWMAANRAVNGVVDLGDVLGVLVVDTAAEDRRIDLVGADPGDGTERWRLRDVGRQRWLHRQDDLLAVTASDGLYAVSLGG